MSNYFNRIAMALCLVGAPLVAAEAADCEALPGDIVAPADISALGQVGDFIFIGADEANADDLNLVQVLQCGSDGQLTLQADRQLDLFTGVETKCSGSASGCQAGGVEMDIEAIAVEGDTLVVVGSHSAKRPRLKDKKKYQKNRARLAASAIKPEPNRARIYRIQLDGDARESSKEHISVAALLAADPVLSPYVALPSKENGIDIEGAALRDGQLYLGFRGPVLRDGYVPVMVFDYAKPDDYELRFVRLDGHGIRGMARVDDGFLIIGGAVGDAALGYQLYLWDGEDMVPGKKRGGQALGTVRHLAELGVPDGGKAEALTVMEEGASDYQLLIAFDGVEDDAKVLRRLSVPK